MNSWVLAIQACLFSFSRGGNHTFKSCLGVQFSVNLRPDCTTELDLASELKTQPGHLWLFYGCWPGDTRWGKEPVYCSPRSGEWSDQVGQAWKWRVLFAQAVGTTETQGLHLNLDQLPFLGSQCFLKMAMEGGYMLFWPQVLNGGWALLWAC